MEESNKVEPLKKRLILVPDPRTQLYYIKFEGGGHLPPCLEGGFTSQWLAEKAIERYVAVRNGNSI
jgi:hypothetical protein